jgi:hypothetical protein
MTNDDRSVFICLAAVASFYMIYSSIKYSLRLREWEKIDGAIVNCDGTLAGDDFVYQLSIKIKIDCKEEIVSLSNEFGKRNIGESVQILRNPKNYNKVVLIDTQNKLIIPLIMSTFLLASIMFYWPGMS